MSLNFGENFLDLISDTKKYFRQLDPNSIISLEEKEKLFFINEINIVKPKSRNNTSRSNASRSNTSKNNTPKPLPSQNQTSKSLASNNQTLEKQPKNALEDNISEKNIHPLSKQSLIKRPATKKPISSLPPISPIMPIKIKPQLISNKQNISKQKSHISDFTILEKPKRNELNLSDVKKIIKEIYPDYHLFDQIPTDKKAKQIAQSWKLKKHAADISILSFRESPQQLLFLKNLTLALDTLYLPTKIISAIEIEKENQWNVFFLQDDLKLIIACDYSIWGLPNLIKHYKEISANQEHFLQNIPLFMLPDISIYLKEPLLKKSLWTSLRQKIHFLVDK